MPDFSEKEFFTKLTAKAKSLQPCPICGEKDFSTYPKFTNLPLQDRFDGAVFGWYMPCGILICKNCGYIHLIALHGLGIDAHKGDNKHEKG